MTKAGLTTNPDEEWEAFKDHHAMKGSRFADWPAAWRNWCRNSAKWAAQKVEKSPEMRARFVPNVIGFTVPKRQPDAVLQALRDNEEAARETETMTVEQRQAALRKLNEIRMGLKKDGKW